MFFLSEELENYTHKKGASAPFLFKLYALFFVLYALNIYSLLYNLYSKEPKQCDEGGEYNAMHKSPRPYPLYK